MTEKPKPPDIREKRDITWIGGTLGLSAECRWGDPDFDENHEGRSICHWSIMEGHFVSANQVRAASKRHVMNEPGHWVHVDRIERRQYCLRVEKAAEIVAYREARAEYLRNKDKPVADEEPPGYSAGIQELGYEGDG